MQSSLGPLGSHSAEPASGVSGAVKPSLRDQYEAVRRASEALASGLSPEDQMVQSMPDASPTKWHLAHTTWFFETFILAEHFPGYQSFESDFRFLYNSYYKQLGSHPNRATRGTFSRPPHARVMQYRQHVNQRMMDLLDKGVPPEISDLVVLGLNHEQQHQELIVTDIKHAFWVNPLRPAYKNEIAQIGGGPVSPMQWQRLEGGVVHIGHPGSDFAFDNELPRHDFLLRPFRLASRLVTNAEYLQFMDDQGYRRPELWLSDGWDTVLAQGWQAPMYWERNGDRWQTFTVAGIRNVEMNEPVCHVSYYEADAFARWSGARLPVEQEWEVAARSQSVSGNFAESGRFHPAPASNSQMFGDVWEWTASPYVAYPGFKPGSGAIGEYNGKFMCNQFVLRGGSCATPQSHIRPTYRNFFPPSARWQFMGIRLAADES